MGVSTRSASNARAAAKTTEETKLPVRAKGGRGDRDMKLPAQPTKGTLKTFDDNDEEAKQDEEPQLEVIEISSGGSDSGDDDDDDQQPSVEGESSDDEAPEAVSTHQAAAEIKQSAKAAQQAAQEQAAVQKRKRQQRDALFKQQAEDRKQLKDQLQEDDAEEERSVPAAPAATGRKRLDRFQIPDVLPAEYLEDSSSDDEESAAAPAAHAKRRRMATIEKSLARTSRGPQDQRVGSTIYRVANKSDERMAPKMNRQSRSRREALLKRGRPAVGARPGFFAKR